MYDVEFFRVNFLDDKDFSDFEKNLLQSTIKYMNNKIDPKYRLGDEYHACFIEYEQEKRVYSRGLVIAEFAKKELHKDTVIMSAKSAIMISNFLNTDLFLHFLYKSRDKKDLYEEIDNYLNPKEKVTLYQSFISMFKGKKQ